MGVEGDVQTTGVETDTGADNGAVDTSTVLTADTAADGAADSSDAGAADAVAADDTSTTGDDSGNTDASDAAGDAEGSQTPPDEYADFKMPEGVQLDDSLMTDALPLFKEMGLTQDAAQKLVDFQASRVQAEAQKQVDAFNQLKTEWREQSANDKEFGGDAFDENVKFAQAAVNKFGTPELKQLMEDYGVGNHPEMLRFMVKVGKLTAEDVPGSDGVVGSAKKDIVSTLYPNDRNK
jgi:hypothetical protein